MDQTQQLCCALFQAVWKKLGSKRLLWERMLALFYDYAFPSMRRLFEALLYGFQKSHPIITSDSSSGHAQVVRVLREMTAHTPETPHKG